MTTKPIDVPAADATPLTPKQAAVLAWIEANSGYYSPTVREIARQFGIKSPNGVATHLAALERKGRIRRTPGIARGIEVLR